ncbi:MAG: diguanylate cyclase [Eubacterium sp.]|nr:diguanylate cyclase [Eubacterium sp.]
MKLHKICFLLFSVVMVAAFAAGIVSSIGNNYNARKLSSFDDDWRAPDGRRLNLNELPRMDEGDSLELTKISPDTAAAGDVWSLVSHNIYFRVLVDGKLVYKFYPEKNITGNGYGDCIHRITVRPAGSMVTLICEPVFPGEPSAFFRESYVGHAEDFNTHIFGKYGLSFALSLLTVIIGLLILILYFTSMNIADSMYSMPALGVSVLLIGLWTSVPTLIPQLFLDDQVIMRVFDYGCLTFLGYPLVTFVNSVTEMRRRIYEWLSLAVTSVCAVALVSLRLFAGLDMHKTNILNVISCAFSLGIVVVIIIDDIIDNRRRAHRYVNRAMHVGAMLFVIGAGIDIGMYVVFHRSIVNKAILTQTGFLIFILLMVMQGQRRMMKEHRMVNHQRFVNRALQYSYSAESAEVVLNQMLEYLCQETDADRAYIFEERRPGVFENTYEYCREGVKPQIDNLKNVPYEGVVDSWYNEFKKNGYVAISNLEMYKKVNERMYRVLKPQEIRTLITCPLEKESGYIGFFGLDNPPRNQMKGIVPIIRLLEFFFVMIMKQRDNQEQLVRYSYVDHLTGVRNRRSLDDMREKVRTDEMKYGMMMCDINGLKKMNDEEGHKAGDAMIREVADCLKGIYGDRRVFRMGGDEFLVVREGGNKEQFEKSAFEVRQIILSKGYSVAMGIAYSDEKDDFDSMIRLVDERMYADKKRYYEDSGEDRRLV